MITQSRPLSQYLNYQDEINEAIQKVLKSGRYILGPQVEAFEHEFASYIGTRFCLGVGSGTDALYLSLKSLDIGPGDEVITVPHTSVATVAAIEACGATPVLVDIDLHRYTIDPDQFQEAITSRTRAVIPVHLYGCPADMRPILDTANSHRIFVIEDCAQAHGAIYQYKHVGVFGHLAAFSFYPTKNLGAIGDGGAVVTSDPNLAKRIKLLRQYGWQDRYISRIRGWNSRLDELQAAILRVKLTYLDKDNRRRHSLAEIYSRSLRGLSMVLPVEPSDVTHAFHQYVIRVTHRDALQQHLKHHEISTLVHYPQPIHMQPAYQGRLGRAGDFPKSEHAASEVLSLPLHPQMNESDAHSVALAIREFFQETE
jgi:dTDP-4-amino-4,6-dideoxygalactose transaminase